MNRQTYASHMAGAVNLGQIYPALWPPVTIPALWVAAHGGHLDDVKRLLVEGVDIEEKWGPNQTSSLYEAAFRGFEDIVAELLRRGADMSSQNSRGNTPLHDAAHLGHVGVVLLLLDNGADVSTRNNALWTPLHGAVFSGHEAVVFILLEHKADVFARSNALWTPLHFAAVAGKETVARVLLHKGADLQSKADDGRTAEDLAIFYGHPRTTAMLSKEAERMDAKRVLRCEAFAMGHLERLGMRSWVRSLDVEVVRMVLEQL